ncbi:TPA: hypothetical protein RTH37_000714 [Campylobacter jejuni]|nr:hypothetical protein [Campylobacter jejuni]
MGESNLDYIKQNFQIHYYFDDNSHSMNAFVRNAMEKDFLNFINEIGNILDIKIKLESQAREEGGLKENIVICLIGCTLGYFAPAVNNILTFYLTGQDRLQNADLKLKDLELKLKELDLELKEEELKNKKTQNEYIKKMEENHKIYRLLSNFYKKVENYEKIKKIGYQFNNSNELIIEREQFKSFIIDKNTDTEIIEEAEIEIISPVLKEDRYKWRGIYNEEKIDFSMSDREFKKAVIKQEHNFINGTTINCQLEISRTFDDYGEETKTLYRVKKVYDIKTNDISKITKFGQQRRKQKEESLEPTLFDFTKDNKD